MSAAKEDFEQLAEALPQIVWIAEASGACTYFNQRWYDVTGATKEQSVGFGWLDAIHPDDRRLWLDAWTSSIKTGAECAIDVRYRTASGAHRWFLVRAVASRDPEGRVRRWFGTSTDIDRQKQIEAALRRSEQLLESSQRMANLGSWQLDLQNKDDRDKNELRWSNQVYRIFGYEVGAVEVTNALFFSLVHPDDRAAIVAAVDHALLTLEPYEIEHRIQRRDGVERVVHEWAVIECDAAGAPLRMLGTCQDITERKEMEAILRHHADQLAEADRRKNEFLAMLAHELRNPLGPIRNAVYLLRQRRGQDDGMARLYEMIDRQVEHMSRLVADLLDVSRITRGTIKLDKHELDVIQLARDIVNDYRPAFEDAGISLTMSAAADPVWTVGDRTRLAQALGNLLHNGLKFVRPGGRVDVVVDRVSNWAQIEVRDDGIGIERTLLSMLFQPFAQADQSLDRSRGGLGLGLALVNGLVALHGGQIEAESPGLGKGATFRMRIPLASPPARLEHPSIGGRHACSRRVLIVEDNQDAAETLRQILTCCGHDVKTAYCGNVALEMVDGWIPDVVVCDIGLPEMDGYTLCQKLRERPEMSGCRFVALTGYGGPEDVRRAVSVGFHRHMTKPVDPAELEHLIAAFAAAA